MIFIENPCVKRRGLFFLCFSIFSLIFFDVFGNVVFIENPYTKHRILENRSAKQVVRGSIPDATLNENPRTKLKVCV